MIRSNTARTLRACLMGAGSLIALVVAGCAENRILPPLSAPSALSSPLPPASAARPAARKARQIGPAPADSEVRALLRYGATPGGGLLGGAAGALDAGPPVTLNIQDASIEEIAEKVLGDLLGASYVIETELADVATLRTNGPSTTREIVGLFEDLLAARGAVLLRSGNVFRIVPADPESRAQRSAPLDSDMIPAGLGYATRVLTLGNIKPSRMAEILAPVVADGAVRSTDDERRLIAISGTQRELDETERMIQLFDVDWLAGMSIALLPLRRAAPADVARELLFTISDENAEGARETRVLPIERARAVLVVSPSANLVSTIRDLVPYLDVTGVDSRSVFLYDVQNRSAAELAELVGRVFSANPRPGGAPQTGVADGEAILVAAASSPAAGGDTVSPVSVVADDEGNALIVRSPPDAYPQILALIESLDTLPSQVLMEVMIAEITLADELRYGVEWFLRFGDFSGQFSADLVDLFNPAQAGLSLLLSGSNAGIVVNALSGITDVNVVSSPSLMVLDNRPATLQIGDQVPVVIQSAVSVNDPDAPIVNTVQYRDTGVTLDITPRISDAGLVVLEIEQNVSDVVETTTSGIDSPTIQQRRIATTVAVNDGESLALGGLIRDETGKVLSGVPVLKDIPFAGELFKNTEDVRQRTELIIVITPRVVRNPAEARQVTEELRSRLISLRPPEPMAEL